MPQLSVVRTCSHVCMSGTYIRIKWTSSPTRFMSVPYGSLAFISPLAPSPWQAAKSSLQPMVSNHGTSPERSVGASKCWGWTPMRFYREVLDDQESATEPAAAAAAVAAACSQSHSQQNGYNVNRCCPASTNNGASKNVNIDTTIGSRGTLS